MSPPPRTYRVRDVARLSGVSVRTLHHYDEIGLLVPSRNRKGYRLYTDEDLLRLQQILIGRELGLSLEDVRASLDDPRFDRRAALVRQREELARRAARAAEMIRAVDHAIALLDTHTRGEPTMDMKEIFDGFDPTQHEDEAQERWGHTDAHRESMQRTKRYSKEDWKALRAEQDAIHQDAAAAMKAGRSPEDPEVRAIVERHRLSIERWFYPCSIEIECRLADTYEADERFAANIDKYGEGLTPFLVAAIRAAASTKS